MTAAWDRARARVTCACAIGLAASACSRPPATPAAPPAPGVSIALYADHAGATLAVIDDRRWVAITGGHLAIDELEAATDLPSIELEALAGPGALVLGACTRARIPAPDPDAAPPSGLGDAPVPPPPPPVVRPIVVQDLVVDEPATAVPVFAVASHIDCAVRGPPGRYLVRVLSSSPTLAYHAEHSVRVAAPAGAEARAHVATTLSIAMPAWPPRDGAPVRATVVAYDGVPGGDAPPRELARGPLALDGSVGVLALPDRDVPARVRRVLAASEDITGKDDNLEGWLQQRHAGPADEADALVWVVLELPGTLLAPGLLDVRVALPGEPEHEATFTAENREPVTPDATGLYQPLWSDDELRAGIVREFSGTGDRELRERFAATITNLGTAPRTLDVEEKLRPSGRRSITTAWPHPPALAGDALRTRIEVAPAQVARAGFVIRYQL